MKIGYIRVSTEEQNTARQEVLLHELGVDEVFIDKASGKNADRPELTRMMNYVRRGDTVIVESISRFARNTRDLVDSKKCLWRVIEKYFGEKPQKKCEKCCRCKQNRAITPSVYII